MAVGCHAGAESSAPRSGQILRVDWGFNPQTLEPGDAGFEGANILMNVMDPLVRLTPGFEARPALAQSWDTSRDGKTIVFHLRHDGRWTNGDRVTARDFQWSWLRTMSPQQAKFWAYEFYDIVGAEAYNHCDPDKQDCAALRRKVRIDVPDDYTLKVHLRARRPWFPGLVGLPAFLALHPPTVRKYGNAWSDPSHIVTDGAFKLVRWDQDKEIQLDRWDGWRDAKDVRLARVVGPITPDGSARVKELDTGRVDAYPGGYVPYVPGKRHYRFYTALTTEFLAFNVRNVPDVNERRALALAIDRESLVRKVAGDLPATDLMPVGMPGFPSAGRTSPWFPAAGDLSQARAVMAKVSHPKTRLRLVFNNTCDYCGPWIKTIAREWKQLGVRTTVKRVDWPVYLSKLGPPPAPDVDVFRQGWIADYPDAYNFLQLDACDSIANSSALCDSTFDHLLSQALQASDDASRYRLEAIAERRLFGPEGSVPSVPLIWSRIPTRVSPRVQGFEQIGYGGGPWTDFSAVSIAHS
jgi:oligopeptide transport system substrate-binding protein